jgi:hypothetical protein
MRTFLHLPGLAFNAIRSESLLPASAAVAALLLLALWAGEAAASTRDCPYAAPTATHGAPVK